MPVAFGRAALAALVAGRADHLGHLELDQLLKHHLDRVADQINAVTGTERIQQLGQGRLGQSHRCLRLIVCS
jgi:hypothetical protein